MDVSADGSVIVGWTVDDEWETAVIWREAKG